MEPLTYSTYLNLEQLLSAQKPKTKVHDEMLFVVTHQVYELWFKQMLWELESVAGILSREELEDTQISLVVARLERVTEIQRLLVDQITVLETMTPMDFLEFRDHVAPASGFQSHQFRMLENRLGLRRRHEYGDVSYLTRLPDSHRGEVKKTETQPSLLDLVDRWLARMPFLKAKEFSFWDHYRGAVEEMLRHDEPLAKKDPALLKKLEMTRGNFEAIFDRKRYDALRAQGERRLSFEAIQAALFIFLYREQPVFQFPFRLLNLLVDVDEGLTQWRYRHALMVFRMIGTKIGTGGSSGFDYLRQTTEHHKIFVDLANLSSFLIPRSALPPIPAGFQEKLGFVTSAR